MTPALKKKRKLYSMTPQHSEVRMFSDSLKTKEMFVWRCSHHQQMPSRVQLLVVWSRDN